jgi:hypothetical protein
MAHKIDVQNLPDEALIILEDSTVKLLLLQLGILDQFVFPTNSDAGSFLLPISDHKTHWITPGIFRGFSEAKENGYMFLAWPKSTLSRKQAEALARKTLIERGFTLEKNKPLFVKSPAPTS